MADILATLLISPILPWDTCCLIMSFTPFMESCRKPLVPLPACILSLNILRCSFLFLTQSRIDSSNLPSNTSWKLRVLYCMNSRPPPLSSFSSTPGTSLSMYTSTLQSFLSNGALHNRASSTDLVVVTSKSGRVGTGETGPKLNFGPAY